MSGSLSDSVNTGTGSGGNELSPFSATSVFNTPIGSGAQWTYNAQLAQGQPFINTSDIGYNTPIYYGTASDPVVTVTDTAAAGGSPATFQVHIPTDATPANGTDRSLTVDDTATQTWYSLNGFVRTGSNTATVQSGSGVPDNGSGLNPTGDSNQVNVGALTEADLQSGSINHTLAIAIPTTMAESYSSTSTNILAPNAWPQTTEDGFALSGNGGPAYSGTVPFGVTVGIPAGTPEPADVAANQGANMLWNELMYHGAMIENTGGSGYEIAFTADQYVSQVDPLIVGMEQYGQEIFQHVEILANQGPNSVNGGGTPLVAGAQSSAPSTSAGTSSPGTSTLGASTDNSGTGTTGSSTNAATGSGDSSGTSTGSGTSSSSDTSNGTLSSSGTPSTGASTTTNIATGSSGTSSSSDPSNGTQSSSGSGSSSTGTGTNDTSSSDNATITASTLTSGQASSGGAGMSFIASPGTSGTSASTDTTAATVSSSADPSGTSPGTTPDTTLNASAVPGSGVSSNDFSTPTAATASGTQQQPSSGAGGWQAAWLNSHPTVGAAPITT